MGRGEIITICEYAEFNHSFLTAGGSAYDVVLAPAVPVWMFTSFGASVRVHARTLSTVSPCSYQVAVRGANPSRRDGAEFQVSGADFTTAAITHNSGPATVPGLTQLSALVTDIQHPYAKVILRATPPATGTVILSIIISVELIGHVGS